MADAAIRTVPVPLEPATYPGVTIALGLPAARWSVRARDGDALAALLGRPVPLTIGQAADGLACLGPDEWLLVRPAGSAIPTCAGQPLSVVDVSEREISLVVEGGRAQDILASGCPRDLSRFAPGTARRTIYEGVEVVLWRESETRFAVDVWRSFAPWLWAALIKAASHP